MKRTNTAKWMENQKRWQINVQKDGVRRSFTSSIPGRNGQREANAKADAWLDDGISGGGIKVTELYKDYVESLKLTTSKSNWIKVESIGKNWVLQQIGARRIESINEQHLQHIIDKAYSAGLSRKTLSNIRTTIMNFLKYCRKRKLTNLSPEDLTIPKGARLKGKRILQPEAIRKVFQCENTFLRGVVCKDNYINAYRFQLLTGLRPGELIGLQWGDIQGNVVHINRSVNVLKETTTGKNENALRHFVLSDKAKEILAEQRKISASESIFEITRENTYYKRWHKFCEFNDIPFVSLYEMRHTFVSIAKQLPEGQVKALVGHSKNMDTFGIYGHEVAGELEQTATEIGSIFSKIISEK